MPASHHFTKVHFIRFKAFRNFTLYLRRFNILVGPNNSGKSTILAAFRILAAAMRRARARNPQPVDGPSGTALGYHVDLTDISVAQENLFYNYDDTQPASVSFTISNGNELILYFANPGHCSLVVRSEQDVRSPAKFRQHFDCPIGFVPILGPVDQVEHLYEKETARRALFNFNAARNFRNIWHHCPDKFDEFRRTIQETWPGMDVEPPTVDYSFSRPRLHMLCPEERIPREICWAGFGFQVWCQMLTHLVQSSHTAIFLIDEPDIYLHSDLQRQLLSLLRNMDPDIIIATHSTEIITEAEAEDIVLVDKRKRNAGRIRNPSELGSVFALLGSNLNPILTQLAKTRHAVFVEGKDFQILSRFAQKLSKPRVASRNDFAVIPVSGFSPHTIRNMIAGMELTLGGSIIAACVLDRDYRSNTECDHISDEVRQLVKYTAILGRKEIENFLLVPSAIDRAASRRVVERARRTAEDIAYFDDGRAMLDEFAESKKAYVMSQQLSARRKYERAIGSRLDDATFSEEVLREFEQRWADTDSRVAQIPGKDTLSYVNARLQERYSISITPMGIIDAMTRLEIPTEIQDVINALEEFVKE